MNEYGINITDKVAYGMFSGIASCIIYTKMHLNVFPKRNHA